MREKDIIENLKNIGFLTIFIFIFIFIVPFILMGSSIKNFTEEEFSEKVDKNAPVTLKVGGDDTVKVYRTKEDKVSKINVEDYILGVVMSEMPASFEEEALKAQAIAARTFYYSKRMNNCNNGKGGEICDSVHCQAYMDKDERLEKWDKKSRDENYKKIKKAVEETKDMVLTFENEIVLYPQFFSTSSGKTENCKDVFSSDVPYLKSINSPGEEISPVYKTSKELGNKEFVNVINSTYKKANLDINDLKSKIEIVSRTDGGAVEEIKIGGIALKGTEFRKLFDLRSANFTLEYMKDKVKINCIGNGHGVGMSQWGANVMAKNGKKYKDILTHYYSGVKIGKIIY